MSTGKIGCGDFTGLAEDYAESRPDYSGSVLNGLIGLLGKPLHEADVADVGAGTGIWTRMLLKRGPRSLVAVEPNADMRAFGIRDSAGAKMRWVEGSGEATGLGEASLDWVTMASSFHWVDFNAGLQEFRRLLRPGGRFTALWNPRLTEASPLLAGIEARMKVLCPTIKRVSSGRSGVTETLFKRLAESSCFEDVIYMEGRHTIVMSPERYLGAWRSVNDVRVQMGPELFQRFLAEITSQVEGMPCVETTYLTRAWSARRRD